MIDHKLSLELYQELIKSLYGKQSEQSIPRRFEGNHTIALSTQKDIKIVN